VVYYERTNSKLASNHFKKIKKNIPAPSRKRKRPKKNPLFINNLIKALIIHAIPNIQKGVNNHVTRIRLYTGIKLFINVIKTKIIQKKVTKHVTRIQTKVKLPKIYYADTIKINITNTIKTDILNYYGESKKKALKKYTVKD